MTAAKPPWTLNWFLPIAAPVGAASADAAEPDALPVEADVLRVFEAVVDADLVVALEPVFVLSDALALAEAADVLVALAAAEEADSTVLEDSTTSGGV